MPFEKQIKDQLQASSQVKLKMLESSVESIIEAVQQVILVLKQGGKVLLCGNGGSAADSQHIAAELVGRFRLDRRGLPATALTTDTSILTAVGNDYGFENIFQRQVEAMGEEGDVLIGISTSGHSRNVCLAMDKAREIGMVTIALMGGEEGPMAASADIIVSIPTKDPPRIQEGHMTFGHILCDCIEKYFFQPGEGTSP